MPAMLTGVARARKRPAAGEPGRRRPGAATAFRPGRAARGAEDEPVWPLRGAVQAASQHGPCKLTCSSAPAEWTARRLPTHTSASTRVTSARIRLSRHDEAPSVATTEPPPPPARTPGPRRRARPGTVESRSVIQRSGRLSFIPFDYRQRIDPMSNESPSNESPSNPSHPAVPETDNAAIAWAEYRSGNHRAAGQFAQYGLVRDDQSGSLWEVYGLSLTRAGSLEEAIDALERASLLHPIGDDARIALAVGYGQAGRQKLSRDLLMQVATAGRLDEFQLLRVAAGLEAIDQPRLAIEACRRAHKLAPELAQVPYQMGLYASRSGYPADVVEALARHAVALEPDNLHYRIGLASLLIRLERPREAMQVLSGVADAELTEITCQCCLRRIANLFFDLGDRPRAARWAERLGQLRHGNPAKHPAEQQAIANETPDER